MRDPDHRPPPSPPLLLLAGPPTTGALWREVVNRLGDGDPRGVVDPAHPTWEAAGAALAAEPGFARRVVVAHGLAVPVAVSAALQVPPRLLILSNGPLRRLDPVSSALSALAASPAGGLLEQIVFRPRVLVRLLASSAALRRSVVNPYVMDRDTVAMLCGPLVADPAARGALRIFLKSLGTGLPDVGLLTCPVFLVWGDADALNPASEADWLDARLGGGRRVDVPGGRLFHPEERPWAIADAIATILLREGVVVPGLTGMSRLAGTGQSDAEVFNRTEEL